MMTDIKALGVSQGADRIAQTGFIKAVETEIDHLNKTGEFKAGILVKGDIPVIDHAKAIILYRMIREILTNVVKHLNFDKINCRIDISKN